ncbi:helix-turn-helix transcriptional regulator [Nonomuraea sp. NPDC049646]|uniref:helix-turn-helix transcriptional regulator n=1 Tax=unclassified Nonomuraea TaxID=2593643 RepID=UPI00378D2AB9
MATAAHLHAMLTLAEVCTELQISRSTFYDWRQKRRAPRCITLPNGSLRVRRADLDAWLNARGDAA